MMASTSARSMRSRLKRARGCAALILWLSGESDPFSTRARPVRYHVASRRGRALAILGTQMPILWSVNDGARANATVGSGEPISFQEIALAFGRFPAIYLFAKPEAPNATNPSALPARVVIEVRPEDGTTALFPQPGYFRLDGLAPADACALLKTVRERAALERRSATAPHKIVSLPGGGAGKSVKPGGSNSGGT